MKIRSYFLMIPMILVAGAEARAVCTVSAFGLFDGQQIDKGNCMVIAARNSSNSHFSFTPPTRPPGAAICPVTIPGNATCYNIIVCQRRGNDACYFNNLPSNPGNGSNTSHVVPASNPGVNLACPPGFHLHVDASGILDKCDRGVSPGPSSSSSSPPTKR